MVPSPIIHCIVFFFLYFVPCICTNVRNKVVKYLWTKIKKKNANGRKRTMNEYSSSKSNEEWLFSCINHEDHFKGYHVQIHVCVKEMVISGNVFVEYRLCKIETRHVRVKIIFKYKSLLFEIFQLHISCILSVYKCYSKRHNFWYS